MSSFSAEWFKSTFETPSGIHEIVEITISGRIDNNTAAELGAILDYRVDDGINFLILNMHDVEYVNSACLREMVRALKRVRRNGGNMLVTQASDEVKSKLELAGLDGVFMSYDSYESAIEAFTNENPDPAK